MRLKEKFTTIFGEEVSAQEKSSLEKYVIEYYSDSVLIKKELFENDLIKNTTHVVSSLQEVNNILITENTGSFELSQQLGNYSIEELLHYTNGVLDYKRTHVIDAIGGMICIRDYNLDHLGNETSNHTEKFYRENNETRYVFEYNMDGSCLVIHDEKYDENDVFGAQIGDPVLTDFTWTGFEYFEFADPINPNDLVVI